ncbi:MAG: EF-P beta-lysylation protein EpmB [Pseudomonadales bacterium]
MIPLTDPGSHEQSWQWHLTHAIRDINELVRFLNLDGQFDPKPSFPLLVPYPYAARMRKGDPNDPLLLQVLPDPAERLDRQGYTTDPLAESDQSPGGGLLHKYRGRVLVIVSGACAINCRYCFRRHFPYQDFQPDSEGWQDVFEYVRNDSSITEVILSGGDPLVLSDKRLAWISETLGEIPHVSTLRIHTRLPVVLPQRVCPDLTRWIDRCPLKIVVVIHANHASELDDDVARAMAKLRDTGSLLLNQSVLLSGVNDSAATLADLSRRLFDVDVLPYYLHLPDKVAGTAHFDVAEERARGIFRELAGELPGYLVPRLAREVPGKRSKITLAF